MKKYAPGLTPGFTIVELLVVLTIIILLSALGLRTYDQFQMRQRDRQRMFMLENFKVKLEQYRSQFGAYVCGDAVRTASGGTKYLVDCAGSGGRYTGNEPEEISGFLNGGVCGVWNQATLSIVGSNPVATSSLEFVTTDDRSWGLYRHGYIDTPSPMDPLAEALHPTYVSTPELPYYMRFCYATPMDGRNSYALFVRMEQEDLNEGESGSLNNDYCPKVYEYYSPGYPDDGYDYELGELGFSCI